MNQMYSFFYQIGKGMLLIAAFVSVYVIVVQIKKGFKKK